MMGFTKLCMDNLSMAQCKDLIGEGMSVHCVGTALLSLLVAIPEYWESIEG